MMEIQHCYNGRIIIETGNTIHFAAKLMIDIYQRFGIVQAGDGEVWIPEKQLGLGESYGIRFGEYDVTVTRKRVGKDSDPKIISMDAARERRRGQGVRG